MKKTLTLTFALLAASLVPALAAPPGPPPLPAPKILVLDRQRILGGTKVGVDVARQIQALGNQAKAELAGQEKALETEGQALQQQVAVLSADAKAQKIKAFDAKQQSFQVGAQRKEQQLQYSALFAQKAIADALNPILEQLMRERGANMIIDRSMVLMSNTSAIDVTDDAINRLNQKMSSYKVTLVNPPAAPQR